MTESNRKNCRNRSKIDTLNLFKHHNINIHDSSHGAETFNKGRSPSNYRLYDFW